MAHGRWRVAGAVPPARARADRGAWNRVAAGEAPDRRRANHYCMLHSTLILCESRVHANRPAPYILEFGGMVQGGLPRQGSRASVAIRDGERTVRARELKRRRRPALRRFGAEASAEAGGFAGRGASGSRRAAVQISLPPRGRLSGQGARLRTRGARRALVNSSRSISAECANIGRNLQKFGKTGVFF